MEAIMERKARKIPVVTEATTGKMWAVQATRVLNPGTRYETTVTVPTFYLDARLGIMNRADARITAGQILGADLPGTRVSLNVHLV